MSYRLVDVMDVWVVGLDRQQRYVDYARLYERPELASGYAHITLIASFVSMSAV